MEVVRLYRPVGIKELELIAAAAWKEFPPRLFWQPIFYPVLNQPYAEQIAEEWNTNDEFSGYCGFVTAFNVNKLYVDNYKVENVGGEMHNELWVPAEKLAEFNAHIIGEIEVLNAFFGNMFTPGANKIIQPFFEKFKK